MAGNGIYCCIGRSRLERDDVEVGVEILDFPSLIYMPNDERHVFVKFWLLRDLELLANNEFFKIIGTLYCVNFAPFYVFSGPIDSVLFLKIELDFVVLLSCYLILEFFKMKVKF